METYKEKVNRFVVEAMDTLLSEQTRAELRIHGIDPDDNWRLIWSFTTEEAATQQALSDSLRWGNLRAYRVRDLGAPVEIERAIW